VAVGAVGGVTRHSPAAPLLFGPRYTPAQISAIDAIGIAWGQKRLTWDEACDLRELVKANRIDEALGALKVARKVAA
jgi:hypothetical protein